MKAMLAAALVFVANALYGQCAQVPAEGTAGAPVLFSWCGYGGVTWSFGDGTQAPGTWITHTYSGPGTYRWAAGSESGTISIVQLAGGQCSFCPIDVPTSGDTMHDVWFSMCPNLANPFTFARLRHHAVKAGPTLAEYTVSFGDGSSQRGPLHYFDILPGVAMHGYKAPGVYMWTVSVRSNDGATCDRSGRIRIINCEISSVTVDRQDPIAGGPLKIQWTTNGSADCHPDRMDIMSVRYEIDLDHWQIDSVDDLTFSRTITLYRNSGFYDPGYHVVGVKPIVCTTCDICHFVGCAPSLTPGYDRRENEQAINIVTDTNCTPIAVTTQLSNQTLSPNLALAAGFSAPAMYEWYGMNGPHDEDAFSCSESFQCRSQGSRLTGMGTIAPSSTMNPGTAGFYWVVATSPCGQSARSNLVAVCNPPVIKVQPQSATISSGDTVTLVATVLGTQLNFQWYQGVPGNSSPVSAGAPSTGGYYHGVAQTTSTLHTSPLTSSTSFYAEARDACGNVVDTQVATISVRAPY